MMATESAEGEESDAVIDDAGSGAISPPSIPLPPLASSSTRVADVVKVVVEANIPDMVKVS